MKASVPVLAFLFMAVAGAHAEGDNTVLLAVSGVIVPDQLPGACAVRGTVQQVFRGTAFHPGQTVSLKVPCDSGAPRLIPAVAVIRGPENVQVIAAPILRESRQGLARLDDSGALIWQAGPIAGRYGPAFGYRVVDGIELPAN